jgi:psiF repeat
MRLAFAANALCFTLMVIVQPVLSQTVSPGAGASSAAPAAAAAPTTAANATANATAAPTSDAAAKHAKRTACLKDAKTKKLVGADKTAFLKTCIDAP